MNLCLDGRSGRGRRESDRASAAGAECRQFLERRNSAMSAEKMADHNRLLSDGYWGAAEDESSTE